METVILIFHLIIIITMVLVILLQRNSNDGLGGLGGASLNPNSIGATRGSSNPLSKATSILATLFICTSLSLAYLANAKNKSVLDDIEPKEVEEQKTVPLALDNETDELVKKAEKKIAVDEPAEKKPAETLPVAE